MVRIVDAIDNGIWGGTSPRGEGRRIQRKHKKRPIRSMA
jgi:hypothetical protein